MRGVDPKQDREWKSILRSRGIPMAGFNSCGRMEGVDEKTWYKRNKQRYILRNMSWKKRWNNIK